MKRYNENKEVLINTIAHNKIAKVYDIKHQEIYNSVEQDRLREEIKKSINRINKQEISVLDFGSGTGNLTKYFLEFGCCVTSLDISQESLEVLGQKFNNQKLQTKLFDGKTIPFADNTFDIVATYSVLHHIPDYMNMIKEFARVLKNEGFIFIDHEANSDRWNPNPILQQYNNLAKISYKEKIMQLIETKEMFTLSFWQSFFYTIFIDPRHKREGDIHVWKDDHINWEEIFELTKKIGLKTVIDQDYLLYSPKISIEEYHGFSQKCSNTKFVLFQK